MLAISMNGVLVESWTSSACKKILSEMVTDSPFNGISPYPKKAS
jgi:hypothetical protein